TATYTDGNQSESVVKPGSGIESVGNMDSQPDGTEQPTDSTKLQPDSTALQANGISPQADIQSTETWTAENTVLSWSSVKYADAYYFVLTDKDGMADGSEMTAEFKIVETKDENDPTVIPSATIYGKDAGGDWQVIGTTGADLGTGTAYSFDLSQTGAAFQPYHKVVKGIYAVDSATSIPYEVDLKTSLEITMRDGVFTYTLALPDSNRLNPPVGSAYGENSIVNSNNDRLRFTDSVEIWSDMQQNEDIDSANWSQAYVKSIEYVAEFNN
ncbi:MAG: hypothetical protein K2P19_00920, partial [Kineothrix sp.]|nr:hypothetical protein [Kineothrix sp.]